MKNVLVTAAVLTTMSAGAEAAVFGFDLTIGPSSNRPEFSITNTSDPGVTLERFSFTIGDTSKNFDRLNNLTNPVGGLSTLITPDAINDGVRSDILLVDFTGFDTDESVGFRVDIDDDTLGNTIENFRNIFFGNGTAPNSIVTATFSNDVVLQFQLLDPATVTDTYTYNVRADVDVAPVPLPAGAPLLLGGVGLLAVLRRRKKA